MNVRYRVTLTVPVLSAAKTGILLVAGQEKRVPLRRLMQGEAMHGLAARLDGRLAGIAHYTFQTSIWFDDVCYLADLFVDETVRGQGAARALIEAVAAAARSRGCPRYYWLTKQDNARARVLYDKVARFVGFIRYDYPMA